MSVLRRINNKRADWGLQLNEEETWVVRIFKNNFICVLKR